MKILTPTSLPRGAGIAACVVAAFLGAILSVNTITLLPPGIHARQLDVAGASAQVVVDRPRRLVSDQLTTDGDYQTLQKRAVVLGNLMTSRPAMRHIARGARIDRNQIASVTRVTANVEATLTEPDSERRASDIHESSKPYRLEVQPHPTLPSLNIYTQAPTVSEARRLADAAVPGLKGYLRELAARQGTDPRGARLHIDQVGPSRGAIINPTNKLMMFGLTFVFVLGLTGLLLALGTRVRRDGVSGPRSRDATQADSATTPTARAVPGQPLHSAPSRTPSQALTMARGVLSQRMALAPAGGTLAGRAPVRMRHMQPRDLTAARRAAARAGDWPRTTRVLPWMIAAMMTVVWLVPFNVIQLSVSLPIDLKFDRLVLPFVIGTWVLALAAGGRDAPRIRLTWIHVGIVAMLGFACLSLVVNAHSLNHTLEFDTSVKKLVLLSSYAALFFVVASVVRRTEIHAFMSYTLVLAAICALGVIWEYRFKYNVFYSLSDQILPSVFQVGLAEPGAIDSIGRRVVRGPAELPLEAVGMITMGLPIAVVRLISSQEWRRRLMYGLCTAVMLAGAIATYRKSAFIAPISVFVTLAYFRRRELLRLAPLGVVFALMIPVLSPGALGSVAAQLSGERLNVPTVSDRNSDYDAVRPDVWSHLSVGRGYGSYEHTSYRILDMELLRQLIEVGVLGLLAYLFVIGATIAAARRPIRARGPTDAPVALAAAAAAVAFLVISTLFDVMSFPHTPYLLLIMAALLAVAITTRGDDREAHEEATWSS